MTKSKRQCRYCEFFDGEDADDEMGACRRFPPVVVDLVKDKGLTRHWGKWLEVSFYAWCGEWKKCAERRPWAE
jgi:hypothetical protein